MRWTPGGVSEDIEDRRGEGGSGIGGFGLGGGSLGIGGTLLLLVLSIIFRTDLFSLFSGGAPAAPSRMERTAEPVGSAGQERKVQFVSFVLDDAQRTWDKVLPAETNVPYRHAKLVLFRDVIRSGCGTAESSTGPFYCPGDEKVYIDLGFYDELSQRFGAPGEFAQAYVIAHEIGHHIQKVLGIERQVRRLQQQNRGAVNALSVRLELQADCLAGVWGHSTAQRDVIDQNDVAAGLQAAAAIGDDRLQRMSRGTVNPESFTHGSSAQRVEWFRRGLDNGRVSACNTFENR